MKTIVASKKPIFFFTRFHYNYYIIKLLTGKGIIIGPVVIVDLHPWCQASSKSYLLFSLIAFGFSQYFSLTTNQHQSGLSA